MQNAHKLMTLIPLDEIEPEALQQLQTVLNRDFIKKIAVMPDIHTGYDLPIGTVALTDHIISPSFVGYDIGCGMCQVKLPDKTQQIIPDLREANKIHDQIKRSIPTGFASHKGKRDYIPFEASDGDNNLTKFVNLKVQTQLGTLGSGNHFIEIGKNNSDDLFVTIHSGSRNAGHQVAEHYMKTGKYLELHSFSGQAYLHDMEYMQSFALANRLAMAQVIIKNILGYSEYDWREKILPTLINEHHNHAIITPEGVLHRKGATPADKGQMGIIPGNMRDGIYITRGLGNSEYLCSASHGAGRAMSRTKAKSTLKLDIFRQEMSGIASDAGGHTLDEAPEAYKDLNMVIQRQNHIVVDIVDYVKPLINVKG